MSDTRGVGVGGLAAVREDYTTSRYNHYAPYTFEEEIKPGETFEYFPQTVRDDYDATMPIAFQIPAEVINVFPSSYI